MVYVSLRDGNVLGKCIGDIETRTGWWYGTCYMFPHVGNNHPN